jgi:AraC family transcriptional regulator
MGGMLWAAVVFFREQTNRIFLRLSAHNNRCASGTMWTHGWFPVNARAGESEIVAMIHKCAAGRFYGLLRSRQVRGFHLTESLYPPELFMSKHSHERAYCCLVLRGAYVETYGASSRECKPSTLILHPVDEIHAVQFGHAGARLFRLEIESACLARIREYSPALGMPAAFHGGHLSILASRLCREFDTWDELAPLLVEGLLLELIAEMSRESRKHKAGGLPRWLSETRELLDACFAEHLDLEHIARLANVHPVHLARTFRKHYRCTIGEYVRRLRLDFARRQLCETKQPLAEISLSAGFADQSHFTRVFRHATGLTPASFRALWQSR